MTQATIPPISVTLQDAVTITGISQDVLRRAIHATTGPRIRAKKNGSRYSISYAELVRYWESLPDA